MKYAVHILTIKLWEWEAVKEVSYFSIAKNGPNEHDCTSYNNSVERIKELKEAIATLTP